MSAKVHVRNAKTRQEAWVAPSRVPHLSPGWAVVEDKPTRFRPGTEEPILDEPQGVAEPQKSDNPEEK